MHTLYLIVPDRNPRLEYAAALLFGRLLGLDYRLIPEAQSGDVPADAPRISYGLPGHSDLPALPSEGLLFEQGIRDMSDPLQLPKSAEQPADALLSYDPLSEVFFMATLYPEYAARKANLRKYFDAHGRFTEPQPAAWQREPAAHRIAAETGAALQARFRGLRLVQPEPSFELTIDVDHPWRYAHKSWSLRFGGFWKALFTFRFGQLGARFRSIFSHKGDPNDIFGELPKILPQAHSRIFFLLERRDKRDGRHTWRDAPYRQLIHSLRKQGYAVGIHPSYKSGDKPALISEEQSRLGSILSEPVTATRQHYLRFRLPDTFRAAAEAGLTAEYSLCPAGYTGWRSGMALPYPWYDLEQEKETGLMLHPACAMDRGLMQYQGMAPDEAIRELRRLKNLSDAAGGTFVIILHNDTFSDSGEWKGWREPLTRYIRTEFARNP